MTFRFASALIVMSTTALAAQQTQTPPKPAPADQHGQMNMRGNEVMGFDQDKTTHHFLLYTDGGAIDVSVNDGADKKNLDAIRSHLPHIAMMFGMGDFSAPMMVHSTNPPGTATLKANKDKVKYTYTETPKGGRVDIVTTDAATLAAVHDFMKFQISDHKTGDDGKVTARASKK